MDHSNLHHVFLLESDFSGSVVSLPQNFIAEHSYQLCAFFKTWHFLLSGYSLKTFYTVTKLGPSVAVGEGGAGVLFTSNSHVLFSLVKPHNFFVCLSEMCKSMINQSALSYSRPLSYLCFVLIRSNSSSKYMHLINSVYFVFGSQHFYEWFMSGL